MVTDGDKIIAATDAMLRQWAISYGIIICIIAPAISLWFTRTKSGRDFARGMDHGFTSSEWT